MKGNFYTVDGLQMHIDFGSGPTRSWQLDEVPGFRTSYGQDKRDAKTRAVGRQNARLVGMGARYPASIRS